jgi:hypothetical protein
MPFGLGAVISLGVAVTVAGAACGATVCTGDCAAAGGIVDQSSLTSPIVTLAADPPCSITQAPADGSGEIFVGVRDSDPPTAGSCQIHATLADGSTWVAILSWAPNGGSGCCANSTHAVGPAPMFTRGNAGGAAYSIDVAGASGPGTIEGALIRAHDGTIPMTVSRGTPSRTERRSWCERQSV